MCLMVSFSHALAGVRWWLRLLVLKFFNANFLSSVYIPLRLWPTSAVFVYTSPMGREKK